MIRSGDKESGIQNMATWSTLTLILLASFTTDMLQFKSIYKVTFLSAVSGSADMGVFCI